MIPIAWIVTWGTESIRYTQRARMRGFVLMLKAQGITPTITVEFRK